MFKRVVLAFAFVGTFAIVAASSGTADARVRTRTVWHPQPVMVVHQPVVVHHPVAVHRTYYVAPHWGPRRMWW